MAFRLELSADVPRYPGLITESQVKKIDVEEEEFMEEEDEFMRRDDSDEEDEFMRRDDDGQDSDEDDRQDSDEDDRRDSDDDILRDESGSEEMDGGVAAILRRMKAKKKPKAKPKKAKAKAKAKARPVQVASEEPRRVYNISSFGIDKTPNSGEDYL